MRSSTIPGSGGQQAFSIRRDRLSEIPVLLAVPHAGRSYPQGLRDSMRDADAAAPKLEDRYVDLIGQAVSEATGCALLVAHAPRAMIDLNRSVQDMDWSMLAGGKSSQRERRQTGIRARGGLGLVPRRLPGLGEIWRGPLEESELEARIAQVHTPYHAVLSETLAAIRQRWGAALLLDLHSMPPLPQKGGAPVEFVIGDRFGSSCAGFIPAIAFDTFSAAGRRCAHNRPYAGGYVLDRHGAPQRDVHAVQLEVCRSAYLDAALEGPGEGLEAVAELIATLVRRWAAEVAAQGGARNLAAQ